VNENAGTADFTVSLSAAAENSVTVDYATSDGTAVAGNDYTATSGTITWLAGDSSDKTISVPITDDVLIELAETFNVNLSNESANATIGDTQGQGTINVDEQATITIDDVAVNENAGTADFTVTLSAAAEDAVTVDYATADGTATVAGGDYTATSGTLSVAAGSLTGTISVQITNDALIELVETFVVNLSNASANATVGDTQGQATINIDDKATITINDITVAEGVGNAGFTVSLSKAAEDDVTVDYATANGTATAGADYTSTSGTLTIPAGSVTGTISVSITNDALVEVAEDLFVLLSNPRANAIIGDNMGRCEISVDEKTTMTINDTTGSEATGTSQFTVSLDKAAEYDITVQYATADNTATAGTDYTATSGTLTFVAGNTTATINVAIINDAEVDPAETFKVNLSSQDPAEMITMGDSEGLCTITDNNYGLTLVKVGSGIGSVVASDGSLSSLPGGTVNDSDFPRTYVYETGDVVDLSVTPSNTPDPGTVFKGWTGDISDSASSTTVTMDSNKTVNVNLVQRYRLTPIAGAHGSISPSTDVIVEHGQNSTFTMTSDIPLYNTVADVLVDGVSVASSTSPATPAYHTTDYSFTNVTANHTIGATFGDHGEDCASATPVGVPPYVSATAGEISPAGDYDYFKVVTTETGTLKAYSTGSTDTYGYLLDSSCNLNSPIAVNDDMSQENNNFYIQERNLPAGTYYIAVKHWESDSSNPVGLGTYTLLMEFNSDDHGSDTSTATFVNCNSTVGGNLEIAGNEDYFKIDVSGTGNVKVYTTGTTDTVGVLMDSSEGIITQDNDSGSGNNFNIERNLSPGTYYVVVKHNDTVSGTGTYTLNVECNLTHTISASAAHGGSISPEGDVVVVEGASQTFTITPDAGNTIYDVEVDGSSVGAVSTYTFNNVVANHTIVAIFELPPDLCVDISDTPLDARFQAAPANVMFVLDDSGSMDWTFMTPEDDGLFRPTGPAYRYVFDDPDDHLYSGVIPRGTPRMHWKGQWSQYNRMYYNPAVTYNPWPTLSDADPDNPRSHPMRSTPTFDLSGSYDTIDTGVGTVTVVVDNEDPSPDFQKTPETASVIIDERDSEFSRTASNGGEWRSATSSQAYNNQYYYTRRTGDYTATWTPNLQAGEYKVYARWRALDNRSTAVPYTINHAGGSDTVTVNQRVNGGKWVLLGTYTFNAGSGNVSIGYSVSSTGSDRVCADAVKFEPTATAWDWATNGEAYNGHYWWTPTDGDYTATWTPNLPISGTWEVQARWHATSERSTSVTYTINHTGGSTPVTVNQRLNGGAWVSLGSYTFDAGTAGNVVLSHTRNGMTDTVCADAVRFVPAIPETIDIKNAHYYTWYDADSDGTNDPSEVWLVVIDGTIKYYQFTDADSDDVIDVGELLPVTDLGNVPAAVKTGRSYAQERQNFANWYSFYRRRWLTAVGAVAKVISQMQGVKIGYYSINGNLVQPVLSVKLGGVDDTAVLLSTLYNYVLRAQGTPLRRGLRAVGRYFDQDDGMTGGIGASPYVSAAQGGECQQAFAIVMTDGYWNGGSPGVGNADGDNNTDYDGGIYGDNWNNTLADVAMYYYERDLSSSLDNIVPPSAEDSATHQHLVTYGISFGIKGTLDRDDYDLVTGPYPTWPGPVNGDPEKIDDLWHAAVNGRGTYFNANNPEELATALLAIMQNVIGRIASSSSVSVNGDELYETLGSDIQMFQASYSSDGWIGDIKSYDVDLVTGEVVSSTYNWSAAEQLETQNWDSGRIIATYDGVSGIPFRFNNLSNELKDLLDSTWTSDDTNARNILNFLRGDRSNEQDNGGSFRNRAQVLGDIVHSAPTYRNGHLYAGANDGMLHVFDATTGDEVFAYVPKLVFENLKELSDPVYAHKFFVDLTPAMADIYVLADSDGQDNDGDSVADEVGETKVKTVLVGGLGKGGKGYYALDITDPSSISSENTLANKVMWEYPRAHTVSIVDASDEEPIVITTATAHGFRTGDRVIIEGVLGNTDANGTWTITKLSDTTFSLNSSEGDDSYTSGGTARVWNTEWDDLGYSFSKPAVVNSNAGWIVIFGNGYNSQSGVAKLFILNADTGETLKIISTEAGSCNGLSSPTPVDIDNDNKVDYVYAGDLRGNMWKFDLTASSAANWDVAFKTAPYSIVGGKKVGTTPAPLFQARDESNIVQPITTKPDVMVHCTKHGQMVVFGTGKYLGDTDLGTTQTNTIYGIWDYGDDDDDGEYLGSFKRNPVSPDTTLSNQAATVVLLEQTVEACDPANATCDGDFWVVNSQNLRVLTNNVEGLTEPWDTTSLLADDVTCGDGLGATDCDPNGYGSHPDLLYLAGWYFDLPLSGERVVSDALIRQGKAIVVAFTPEDTPCGSGGDSVVMEMDACSGGRLDEAQFDINEDNIIDENDLINIGTDSDPIWVAPTGVQSEGRLQPPAILRMPQGETEMKYFSSSRGTIVTVEESAVTLGMSYWMEFE